MLKPVALVALITFAAADTSVEERLRALEQRTEQKIAALEAKLNATPVLPAGALLTFADGRTKCPIGYAELAHLKGSFFSRLLEMCPRFVAVIRRLILLNVGSLRSTMRPP